MVVSFTKIYPRFTEWLRKTGFDGDFLGKQDYLKLFDDTDYVVYKDRNVKYNDGRQSRSLIIDHKEALDAGLNLDGFILE